MEQAEVITKIQQSVSDAQVLVEGADCSFSVVVISPQFEGQLPVKRQQAVLASFSELLATGELHALTVKAHTPSEWSKLQAQQLTQLS